MLQRIGPYLWRYRWRVAAALGFLVAAKLANVGVPVLLKNLVDALAFGCRPRCSPSCAS